MEVNQRSNASASKEVIPSFCVNSIPWKLVRQTGQRYSTGFTSQPVPSPEQSVEQYLYLSKDKKKMTNVESFAWKWSPCGRYGVDVPGGRDLVNMELKKKLAVFDIHKLSWELYDVHSDSMKDFQIPRLAFIYWFTADTLVAVSLLKGFDGDELDNDVEITFRQAFFKVDHATKTFSKIAACKYATRKTITTSYWYHIFENRRGEPFVDSDNNLWLVFSNGKDCLVLIPYEPHSKCFKPKYVQFDMDAIVGKHIGEQVNIDPFISTHYVPFVYRNEINFFVRVNTDSLTPHGEWIRVDDPIRIDPTIKAEQRGTYQIRFDLAAIIKKYEDANIIDDHYDVLSTITAADVELFRKIDNDVDDENHYFTQHKQQLVITKWFRNTVDKNAAIRLKTQISCPQARKNCCHSNNSSYSFCTINLDTEQIRKFDTRICATDVITPHPSGSVFMFRYKEDYAMRFSELPFFAPLSMETKCHQALNKCIVVDPMYNRQYCVKKLKRRSIGDTTHESPSKKVAIGQSMDPK